MVNGMGGTPLIELYVVFEEVRRSASPPRAPPSRGALVGNYITSLDMAGASITVLPPHPRPHRALGRSGGDARPAVGALRIAMEGVLLVDVTTVRAWITQAARGHRGEQATI